MLVRDLLGKRESGRDGQTQRKMDKLRRERSGDRGREIQKCGETETVVRDLSEKMERE